MIEKGIGKYVYDTVFGTTDNECKQLKNKWFIHCFQQPRIDQQAFVWPSFGDEKGQSCKKLFEAFEHCKKNLKT